LAFVTQRGNSTVARHAISADMLGFRTRTRRCSGRA
jgi:hypothetical protein